MRSFLQGPTAPTNLHGLSLKGVTSTKRGQESSGYAHTIRDASSRRVKSSTSNNRLLSPSGQFGKRRPTVSRRTNASTCAKVFISTGTRKAQFNKKIWKWRTKFPKVHKILTYHNEKQLTPRQNPISYNEPNFRLLGIYSLIWRHHLRVNQQMKILELKGRTTQCKDYSIHKYQIHTELNQNLCLMSQMAL